MHELGLPYKTKPIGPRTGETKTAEYTRLNPRQKVPLLQDGDFCIGESAAIVAYLSRTYSTPERSLIPETRANMPPGWNGASSSSRSWIPPAFT
jgi:glutathione S-transferase